MILAYYANYPTNILKTGEKIILSGRLNFCDASHSSNVTVKTNLYVTSSNTFFLLVLMTKKQPISVP